MRVPFTVYVLFNYHKLSHFWNLVQSKTCRARAMKLFKKKMNKIEISTKFTKSHIVRICERLLQFKYLGRLLIFFMEFHTYVAIIWKLEVKTRKIYWLKLFMKTHQWLHRTDFHRTDFQLCYLWVPWIIMPEYCVLFALFLSPPFIIAAIYTRYFWN